ncbi:MAG: class I SAM-dependent methyltransferase, partial [Defluviitaleaceae bacterium]|nr:class I SAM-dependent methyltransferase [Defluviitaleaceae bacterium]
GLTVDGVDLSAEMLAKCRLNLDKHKICAKLYQQDLTSLDLPNKYGAIIMPTGSFCLLSKNLVNDVLNLFYSHLDDGGKIIIDLEFPMDFKSGEVRSYSYPLCNDIGILFTSSSQDIDWIAQKTSYIHRYELLKNGEVQKTEVSNFTLYWYGILEFEMLLKSAGFVDISYELGYGTSNNSSLITFSAVKK